MQREAAAALRRLGKRVKAARQERGFTQEVLAERMGLSPGYIRRIEGGQENLTVASLVKLARALGTTLPRLFESAGE